MIRGRWEEGNNPDEETTGTKPRKQKREGTIGGPKASLPASGK